MDSVRMDADDRIRLTEQLPPWIRLGCHDETHDYFIYQAYRIERLEKLVDRLRDIFEKALKDE